MSLNTSMNRYFQKNAMQITQIKNNVNFVFKLNICAIFKPYTICNLSIKP